MNTNNRNKRNNSKLGAGQDISSDAYLKAAAATRVPVSIHFIDGEVVPSAMVKQVNVFTILFGVEGGDVLVYKNALKKITAESRTKTIELQEKEGV